MRNEVGISSILHLPSCLLSLLFSFLHLHSSIFTPLSSLLHPPSSPSVFDLFLQVFDEGRVTDAKGRTADARNAIFVMTSNIQPGKQFNVGFQDKAESRTAMQHEVKARFRAEFINRVDEQIVFRPLSEEDARRRGRNEERGMRIEVGVSSILHLPSFILRPCPSPFERADSEW